MFFVKSTFLWLIVYTFASLSHFVAFYDVMALYCFIKCKNDNVSPSIYLKKSHCFHFKNESHLSSLWINHTRLPFVDGAKGWKKMDLVSLFCRFTYRTCILCINDWFEVGGGAAGSIVFHYINAKKSLTLLHQSFVTINE